MLRDYEHEDASTYSTHATKGILSGLHMHAKTMLRGSFRSLDKTAHGK